MPESNATLTVREGPHRGQSFDVAAPATVGRSKSCTIALEDPDCSRVHFVIEFEANEYTVRDNGSVNGTFLNGRRVNLAALRHGDLLTLGATTLLFQVGVVERPAQDVSAAVAVDVEQPPPFDELTASSSPQQLEAALNKYKALYRSSELISHVSSGGEFFPLVLEHLVHVMQADRGLLLLGASEANVEVAARVSRVAEVSVHPISTTLLRRVLLGGEAILVKDVKLDDRLLGTETAIVSNSQSLLCAPLRTPTATFGAIQLESHSRARAFDENDLKLLAAVAQQAALALSHGDVQKREALLLRRASLQRFADSAAAERLLQGAVDWETGRTAMLSLLFLDLRPLSAGQPSSVHALNEALEQITARIFAFGGVLSRVTPDALVAFWAPPFSESADPRRAVDAALDVQSLLRRDGRPPLPCALHWGQGFVGAVGPHQRRELAAVGPEVEDTARLAAHVSPGEIGASEALYRELSTVLDGEWTDSFTLRADAAPTRLFRVRGLRL